MSKVFLDTNLFIDLVYRRETDEFEYLNDHELFISPLSYHIFFYTQRLKVPNAKVNDILPAQRAGFPSLKKDDISAFNSSSGIARGFLECCYKGLDRFNFIGLEKKVLKNSLEGPTLDLEDNIHLHSAAEAECDYFLTLDKKLLSMKFFGKTRIISNF